MLRPRTVGSQSQPIEAWKVGLSPPSSPPFFWAVCAFCSFVAPVYAIEAEVGVLAAIGALKGELAPIPEIGIEERLGDLQLVVGHIGIGYGSYIIIG